MANNHVNCHNPKDCAVCRSSEECGGDPTCDNVHCAYDRGARAALRCLQATLAALRKIKPEMLWQAFEETLKIHGDDALLTIQDEDFAYPDKVSPKFRPLMEIAQHTRLDPHQLETKRLV